MMTGWPSGRKKMLSSRKSLCTKVCGPSAQRGRRRGAVRDDAGSRQLVRHRSLYRPLARTCAAVAVACLGVGAARPPALFLGLTLVLLLSIPWALAIARRLANAAESPID